MEWTERLNRSVGRMPLGTGTVEILHWAYDRHLPDNRPHRHTFFEVCQVGGQGEGEFRVQAQANSIGPGDLFIARPGVIHQIVNTSEPNMELRWVSFQWTPPEKPSGEADALLRAFANSPQIVATDAGAVAALWRMLETLADAAPRLGSEEQLHLLASALLLGIAQAASERLPLPEPAGTSEMSRDGDRTARLAVRFVHDNLNRPLPLPEIAAQVHCSPRHLSRAFARFAGKSPAQYVTHARMDRARGLLRSDLPLKEIAATVGYPDIHHFTRVFTAHFGCPPGEMRRHPELHPVPNLQNSGDLV